MGGELCLERPLEREFFADILIEHDRPTRGIGAKMHCERAPVAQGPGFLDRAITGMERQTLTLPALIIALFRQAAEFAQPVEDVAMARLSVEPGLRQLPKRREGGIAPFQPPVGPEHGHGDMQAVEQMGARLHLLLETGLRIGNGTDVERHAGHSPVAQRDMGEREAAPASAKLGVAFGLARCARGQRRGREIGFIAIDGGIGGLRRLQRVVTQGREKGAIGPAQREPGIAQPYRHGQGVQKRRKLPGTDGFGRDPHRRAGADGPPAQTVSAALSVARGHLEAFAALVQRFEPRRHSRAVRPGNAIAQQEIGIAQTDGLVTAPVPQNDDVVALGEKRVAQDDGGAGAGAEALEPAARTLCRAAFGKRPDSRPQAQRHTAASHNQMKIVRPYIHTSHRHTGDPNDTPEALARGTHTPKFRSSTPDAHYWRPRPCVKAVM